MNFDLKEWYADKQDDSVLYSYMGELENMQMDEVLGEVEGILREKQTSSKVIKKVYNVLVECLQNIYHHGAHPPGVLDENISRFGVVMVRNEGFHYRIIVGNFLKVSGIKLIRDRIDQINTLSVVEKRSLYKEILNNNRYSDKGGGGLGMIDIARKTANNMEYQFFDFDGKYIFLALNVIIS